MIDRITERVLNRTKEEREPAIIENRVLVLGSNLSGAESLASELKQYLVEKGIENPRIDHLRDAGLIKLLFHGDKDPLDIEDTKRSGRPKGVILFPEMRQYDPFTGQGMFLNTYGYNGIEGCVYDDVKKLCHKYNVPLVEIGNPEDVGIRTNDLHSGLKQIFELPSDLS